MRQCISYSQLGNRVPIYTAINFLPKGGNLLPPNNISVEPLMKKQGLCFEHLKMLDGSNLTIVARDNFPFFVQLVVYCLLRRCIRAFLSSIIRISQNWMRN